MAGARAGDASRVEALADEQAALRRVATLVAQGAPADTLFAVVAEQVADVLRVSLASIVRYEPDGTASELASRSARGAMFAVGTRWSLEGTNVVAQVRDSGKPARIDDYEGLAGEIAETVRRAGIRSTVGIPIAVAGRLWGVMVVSSFEPDLLPTDTEARLEHFTELVATAIANSEAREEIRRLADEQAALRRVATLVAKGATLEQVFANVAEEVAETLGAIECGLLRDEGDGTARIVAISDASAAPIGTRVSLDEESVTALVLREGRAARIDDYSAAVGDVADGAGERGIRSSVGCPIVVGERTWGVMAVAMRAPEPLPAGAEARIAQFSELVATAIANSEARAEIERLADQQAALRSVATLVARGPGPEPVFRAVADATEAHFGADISAIVRFDADGKVSVMGAHGGPHNVGARVELDPGYVVAAVRRTGEPARFDSDDPAGGSMPDFVRELRIRSGLATPIIVDGELWGAITVASLDRPLPAGTERRLADFTELMATAVSNTQARQDLQRLVEEQAALRRVATLVAGGASPTEVFEAVAAEMRSLLGADGVTVSRYEAPGEVTLLAHRGPQTAKLTRGTRVRHDGENVTSMVRGSRRPARMEHYAGTKGAIAELAEQLGVRSSVGAPIVVDGRLWGVVIATWGGETPPAVDTEYRMAQFAELLDTAIANADTLGRLTASRARLLTAGDEARRRVVRDLYDGAQQRLVHTIVTLKLAAQALDAEDQELAPLIREALDNARLSNAELRELARGIIPPILTRGGLRAAVDIVVDRAGVPVEVDVTAERFPAEIEASAYFIVAEALTNVFKHARASSAAVRIAADAESLHVEVRDDGIGGADPDGHGLVGISDRATALGGRLDVESPEGGGTVVTASLPAAAAF